MQEDSLPSGVLHEEYTIDTPENVTFGYNIAGIGSRFIGALIDTSLLLLALVLLNIAISMVLVWIGENASPVTLNEEADPSWVGGVLLAIYTLINFGLIWGYYLAFELLWNGQSPGKRLARTQVVQTDGTPAGFTDIAIRNLVRIVDFLPFAYALGFVVMLSNRRARRLGDFAANTLVIRQREQIRLADLTYQSPAAHTPEEEAAYAELLARFPQLRQVTAEDYQLMRDVLARQPHGSADALVPRLAAAMALRSGAAAPAPDAASARSFLEGLVEAYQALRAYISQGAGAGPRSTR